MFKIINYFIVCIFAFAIFSLQGQESQNNIVIDFTQSEVVKQWHPLNHIKSLRSISDGVEIKIDGEDPYFAGPPMNLPSGQPLWMMLKLWSEKGGMTQVFYFKNNATEQDSVRFDVPPKTWYEVEIPLPKLGNNYRFRIDPPGNSGTFVLSKISFEPRKEFVMPSWKWEMESAEAEPSLTSGNLTMHLNKKAPFGYEFRIHNTRIARGFEKMIVGYVFNKELFWKEIEEKGISIQTKNDYVEIVAKFTDAHGGAWEVKQKFIPMGNDVVETTTEVACSQNRQVMFFPLHFLVVGQKTWKTNKTQALFAGLEYLENEASSSEADIRGPEASRQTPPPHKVTFPLMSIVQGNLYIGLIWENHAGVAPLFDSPDRFFNSGAHVIGVLYPGWEGTRRIEGDILPGAGATVGTDRKIVSRAWIIGGTGNTVVPSVQQYIKLKGIPELPDIGMNFSDYVKLTAYGWLKSKIRENNLYRHAYWQGFGLMPAADAAFCEEWLSGFAQKPLSEELLNASVGALSAVKEENYYQSGVGHVRTPTAPLVYGNIEFAIKIASQSARHHLSRVNQDGFVVYKPGSVDYGKTHFTNHASGLTAHAVVNALEAAVFSGEKELIEEALKKLRQLDIYNDGVPRGAQTWEVPLHTPDILASAHLVKAYAIGYELTGDKKLLERAIYWAWTGVPFVYLVNPTSKKVGPYSTIAVYGATSWVAPVWMGLPVQWCGLVYADALYMLSEIEPSGPWRKLADGITAAGVQHTYPIENSELAGLLPDSFALKEQQRNPPAINPATLQVCAVKYFKQTPLYSFKGNVSAGLIIHAPGQVEIKKKGNGSSEFIVSPWTAKPYYVLINGLNSQPRVLINNKETMLGDLNADATSCVFNGRNLIIKTLGISQIQIK